MNTTGLLAVIGLGVLLELLLYLVLRFLTRLDSKAMTVVLVLAVIGVHIPWTLLNWRGGDVFAIELGIFVVLAYVLGIVGHRSGTSWHWGPAIIVAFFAMVIAVNVTFVGLAETGITGIFAKLLPQPKSAQVADSRFPGTVPYDYQKKEALYNQYLKQVEEQQARGWRVRKGWRTAPVVGQPQLFLLEVRDAEDQPVSGATVSGTFIRPSNSEHDFSFSMRPDSPGFYVVELEMPLPGVWNLVVTIDRQGDTHEIQATTSVATAGT
ncbi:FixH family protein [Solemya velum gill symbiont]|uniref:FixH family protein n=1 Tax=Solemya velum gill symbiont TaxID=2340 RepID=UPI0009974F5D|nr:FixH family protein [Solemya velum gill symbiont]OOY99922.1 hypothetical protein BOW19_02080 [Solemya velum gill symbiont]OOZ02079.1 hypothetical protein BOW20_02075 [Solemya velum gill symbiont]OOZ04539.1 hypothetical protein BOW21_02700 [Solemya velum gill symbiont]OOZ06784.1 hypothetical protein BOW22_02685 [Solemya velum gill symbiont]OOZ08965.1 hypothetical protein BOW23_02680 [Solemya velum gill symbiont]